MLVKKVMRKAQNAAGVGPRQGFVTRRMAFLAATRRERAQSGAPRRYPPCPHVNAGGGVRLDGRPIELVRAPGNSVNRP